MDDTACWTLLAVIFGAIIGAVIGVVILIAANLFVTSTKRQPLNVLRLLAFIAAAALLMGFIVPGIVAWVSGVFYQKDVQSVVCNKFPDVKKSMEKFNHEQEKSHESLRRIDEALIKSLNGSTYDLSSLRAEKANYQSKIKRAAPFSIQPFYQHIVMYFWPIMYLCLGTLVFLLSQLPDHRLSNVKRAREILIITSTIFVFLVGYTIYRNISLTGPPAGRIVYAYSNFDVAPASFTVQITHFFIFSFLLAMLWHQWSGYFAARVREIESNCFESGLEATFNVRNLDRVSKELLRWQICLGVLSTGFIMYTWIFWKQIIKNGDLRFLIEAFVPHALWLISAVVMAMPFWATWRAWRFDRIRAIGELVHRPDSTTHDLESKLSALRELRPVGSWSATTVIATVLSSIVAPLVQLLLKLFEVG